MAATYVGGKQIKDGSVQRADLDVSTVGQSVIIKIVQGSGISLSSTGADSGTGDVTVNLDQAVAPTWTSSHTFNNAVTIGTGGTNTYSLIGASLALHLPVNTTDIFYTGNSSSVTSGIVRGASHVSQFTGTSNSTASLIGITSTAGTLSSSTGNLTTSSGVNASGVVGVRGRVRHQGTGTIAKASAFLGTADNNTVLAQGGVFTDVAIFDADTTDKVFAGSTWNSYTGFLSRGGDTGSGTITTRYAFKAEAYSGGGTTWAYYAVSDPSYFGGKVGIGTSPTYNFDILGNGANSYSRMRRNNDSYDLKQLFESNNISISSPQWSLGINASGYNYSISTWDGTTLTERLAINASTGAITGVGSGLTSLNASNLSTGTTPTARLGSGTANTTTFLRGDNSWATPTASVGFVNSETTAWKTAIAALGATVSDKVLLAVDNFISVEKGASRWTKFYRFNPFAGSNATAATVPVLTTLGASADVFTNLASYTEGNGLAFNSYGSGGVDTGIPSSSITYNNVSLWILRKSPYQSSNGNFFGFPGGGDIGIWDSSVGLYGVLEGGTIALNQGGGKGYNHRTFGLLGLNIANYNGGNFNVSLFVDGQVVNQGPFTFGASMPSSVNIQIQNTVIQTGGYIVAQGLTDSEAQGLSDNLEALLLAIGPKRFPDRQYDDNYLFIGDSLTYGMDLNTNPQTPYFKQSVNRLGNNNQFINAGTVGRTANSISSEAYNYGFNTRKIKRANKNIAVVWAGTNDLGNTGDSAATTLGYLQTIGSSLIGFGWTVIFLTVMNSSNYSGFTNLANYNAQAPLLNNLLRTSTEFTDGTYGHGIVEIDRLDALQNATSRLYRTDGIHLTQLALNIVGNVVHNKLISLGGAAIPATTTLIKGDGFGNVNPMSDNKDVLRLIPANKNVYLEVNENWRAFGELTFGTNATLNFAINSTLDLI